MSGVRLKNSESMERIRRSRVLLSVWLMSPRPSTIQEPGRRLFPPLTGARLASGSSSSSGIRQPANLIADRDELVAPPITAADKDHMAEFGICFVGLRAFEAHSLVTRGTPRSPR